MGMASTTCEAVEMVGHQAPDVALIDFRLPDGEGAQLTTPTQPRAAPEGTELLGRAQVLGVGKAEVLEATRGRDWVLIENVAGLLSSNGGRDVGVVLGVVADLVVREGSEPRIVLRTDSFERARMRRFANPFVYAVYDCSVACAVRATQELGERGCVTMVGAEQQ